MNVLHVLDRLTDRGGAYQHALGVIEYQRREEHVVALAVGADDGTVGLDATVVPGLDARTSDDVAIEELMDAVSPDVIHVHNVMNPEAIRKLGRVNGVVRVMTVQDHRLFCPGQGKWTSEEEVCERPMSAELCKKCFTDRAYEREMLELTEARLCACEPFRLVVLSEYMKRELVSVGVDARRVSVIPPFVHDLDVAAAPSGEPCVLFVGRLVDAKGVRDAVTAWERSGVDLPLVLAGTGTLRGNIAHPRVDVTGWLSRAQLSAVYRRAAALLLPSRWQEPFGIVGLEALSMGVPVVAWDSGGVREWHPGEGLVAWGDVDELAVELSKAVGRRASMPAGFDRDALMARLERVYCSSP